jgi:mannose-6-phosphate isomerase-like protein (cupin superfamily)
MKLVKKSQAKIFKNSEKCIAYEYFIGDKDINGAVIEIEGRYPNSGRVTNKVCKEIGYIISGSGYVVVEGKKLKFKEGDLVFIEAGERYYWYGDKLKMFMPCSPAFYPEQHKEVE